MLMRNPQHSRYVHFKSSLLYDWCMFIKFHPSINVFIQVGNLNRYFVKLMILQCIRGI